MDGAEARSGIGARPRPRERRIGRSGSAMEQGMIATGRDCGRMIEVHPESVERGQVIQQRGSAVDLIEKIHEGGIQNEAAGASLATLTGELSK